MPHLCLRWLVAFEFFKIDDESLVIICENVGFVQKSLLWLLGHSPRYRRRGFYLYCRHLAWTWHSNIKVTELCKRSKANIYF